MGVLLLAMVAMLTMHGLDAAATAAHRERPATTAHPGTLHDNTPEVGTAVPTSMGAASGVREPLRVNIWTRLGAICIGGAVFVARRRTDDRAAVES